MTKQRALKAILTSAICVILILLFFPAGGGAVNVSAASASLYTGALEDLKKDKNFNIADYPAGGDGYKLDVIQVAESDDGELFAYVYQPYGKIAASSISISKTIGESYDPQAYDLSLLNFNGVFYKYLVKDFELKPAALRYYNISQIWRKWDRQIDDPQPDNGQTIAAIPYEVGKLWTATTVNGTVSYTETETETVEIVNPYASSVRFPNGTSWFKTGKCDAHFVSFDVGNYDIDRLLSATVTYKTQTVEKSVALGTKYGEISQRQYATVNHDEKASNNVNGLFGEKYTWDRISRTSDFVNDVSCDDQTKAELLNRTWILCFLETDYKTPTGADDVIVPVVGMVLGGGLIGGIYTGLDYLFTPSTGTVLSEVAVLRLEFEVNGKVYNLGTVTKVVNPSPDPIEEKPDKWAQFWQTVAEKLWEVPAWAWALIIIAVVAIVVGVLSIFFPIVRKILAVIWKVLKVIAVGLWKVISAPFRLIAAAIRNAQARKQTAATSSKSNKKRKKKKSSKKAKK